MPVCVEVQGDRGLTVVTYTDTMTADAIIASFREISAPDVKLPALIVDLQACQLNMTAAEFMRVIDCWYDVIGIDARAALVFNGEGQKDQAMLFETKSFLVGGRSKSFTQMTEARSWLESWTAPSADPA